MPAYAYVNGQYCPHDHAVIPIEDRGHLMADAVYEVIGFTKAGFIDLDWHLDRLWRSMHEIDMPEPMSRAALTLVMQQLIAKNKATHGNFYMQVSRGVAPRDFVYPDPDKVKPCLTMFLLHIKQPPKALLETGARVITVPDQRWARCDIKATGLLAPAMGKQAAKKAGAVEAWQYDANGMITEGTSTNAFIVTKERQVLTRPADHHILCGVTRLRLIEFIKKAGYDFVERAFSIEEACNAAEAFLSSTTLYLLPIIKIDDSVIGDGKPGPLSRELLAAYRAFADAQ